MNKFKITLIEKHSGLLISEIIESTTFPDIDFPLHAMKQGSYGTPIKVELILNASKENTYDLTKKT